jgi:hypothetical protein
MGAAEVVSGHYKGVQDTHDGSSECYARSRIKDEYDPPNSPPDLSLERGDAPEGQLPVQAQADGHTDRDAQIERSGVGLISLLREVAQKTERLYQSETPCLGHVCADAADGSLQEVVDDRHGRGQTERPQS